MQEVPKIWAESGWRLTYTAVSHTYLYDTTTRKFMSHLQGSIMFSTCYLSNNTRIGTCGVEASNIIDEILNLVSLQNEHGRILEQS